MRGNEMKEWHDRKGDQRMFHSEANLFSGRAAKEESYAAQNEGPVGSLAKGCFVFLRSICSD